MGEVSLRKNLFREGGMDIVESLSDDFCLPLKPCFSLDIPLLEFESLETSDNVEYAYDNYIQKAHLLKVFDMYVYCTVNSHSLQSQWYDTLHQQSQHLTLLHQVVIPSCA